MQRKRYFNETKTKPSYEARYYVCHLRFAFKQNTHDQEFPRTLISHLHVPALVFAEWSFTIVKLC